MFSEAVAGVLPIFWITFGLLWTLLEKKKRAKGHVSLLAGLVLLVVLAVHVSFPQLEELISPHMCRPKPRISNEEKQVVDVLYISGRFAP